MIAHIYIAEIVFHHQIPLFSFPLFAPIFQNARRILKGAEIDTFLLLFQLILDDTYIAAKSIICFLS